MRRPLIAAPRHVRIALLAMWCVGCRDGRPVDASSSARAPKAVDVARVDGGASADASAQDGSTFALRVVAVSADRVVILRPWEKDRAIVDAGLFVYGTHRGGLRLLGDVRDYPSESAGDDLVGFDSKSPPYAGMRRLATHPDRVLVAYGASVRAWNGERWAPATDIDPKKVTDREWGDDYFMDGPPPPPGELAPVGCKPLLTADDEAYGTCENAPFVKLFVDPADRARTPPVWAGRFVVEKRTFFEGLRSHAPMAVARDGALWFGDGATLRRVTVDGHATTLALPSPDEELARPHFAGEHEGMMTAVFVHGPSGSRYWQSTRLERANKPITPFEVARIVPQRDGSVWIQATSGQRSPDGRWIIYRWGPPDVTPITIGTAFDQQVEIRNANGLRAWNGACPQAFVVANGGLESRFAALKPIVTEARKKKIAVELVEGTLGSRPVRGVLLHHEAPATDAKTFARTTTKLAELLGEPGGARAEAFCSVPALTRVLELR